MLPEGRWAAWQWWDELLGGAGGGGNTLMCVGAGF